MLSFARAFSAIFYRVTACYHPSTDAVLALSWVAAAGQEQSASFFWFLHSVHSSGLRIFTFWCGLWRRRRCVPMPFRLRRKLSMNAEKLTISVLPPFPATDRTFLHTP